MEPAILLGLTPAFGADAILAPAGDLDAWHHRRLTQLAALEAGWSEPAAIELGRHADAIDRMIFNPFWIMAGGPRRAWGAHAAREVNRKVHFDDLPVADLVSAAWQRHIDGARVAVRWAATLAEGDDVRVVRCAVGLLMHAVQDFYSHSTWIDRPDRRSLTWQETSDHSGVLSASHVLASDPRHGEFGLRGRRLAIPARIPLRGRLALGPAVAGLSEGITLDSRWQAPLGAATRGIALDGDAAFEVAAHLAQRSARQVLHALALDAEQAGLGGLWQRASAGEAAADPLAALEDVALMPQEFLAAGVEPGREPDPDAWFLRLSTRHRPGRLPGGRIRSLGPFVRRPSGSVPAGWSAVAFSRGRMRVEAA